ncbi:MAG: tetratricopeptide repeat protein, partial [Lentisphaeria bacterium]|nr:tetratricopeptide repeat protein [Lentisphaeria bacterium]
GRYDEALELLEKFLRMRPDSSKAPEALILAVKLFEKIGNYTTAVEYADRILDKYPNTTFAVEAAMRGGSSCFQSGKYQQALKYYERAGELGGHGVMAQIAAGEAADCHLLLRKPENLAAARRIYARLASETEFPALRVQALYKLGLAFEYSSMNMKALEVYEKLLSLAVSSAKIRNSSGVGSWCARAAHSALRIILSAVDMPDGSQRAQRVYQMYSYLALPGSSDELRNYLKEIQKHYNLLD